MSESKSLEPSFFSYLNTLQDFKDYCKRSKEQAELEIRKILKSDLIDEQLLRAVDEANSILTIAFQHLEASQLIHPQKVVRDFISKTMPTFYYLPDYTLAFSLLENKDLHTKLKNNISEDTLDHESKFFYGKIMLGYKINGINLGPKDSKKLKNLRLKCRELESKFALNIAENIPTVYFKEDELRGVPKDIIKSNKQKDGQIKLKLVSNNKVAVLTQCEVKETREKVAKQSGKYAKPLNKNITIQFLKVTKEIAKICGFKNYAELAMATKMIENPENAEKFIQDLKHLSNKRLTKEIEAIKKVKLSFGDKSKLSKTDRTYYGERLVEKISGLKEEELRPYFPYKHVKEEILNIFSEMFSLTFQKEEILEVWNKEIETYLVKSKNKLLGRIHLDMHPRDGKYTHACQTDIRRGKRGGNLSEAILVCNLNRPDAKSDGLQSIDEVETFFHEFGHLLHEILGTQNNKYYGLGGTSVQWDFVEAPSQLLEEIIKDGSVVKRLSSHHKTGQQIPNELFEKMLNQSKPLRASFISEQAAFSKISLSLFLNDKLSISSLEETENKIKKEYLQTQKKLRYFTTYSFDHAIGNYYSNYYTYMWSLAISKDLFTKFNKNNLLDKKVAEHYRKTILEPGGSRPAAELVKDFLGREWNMNAFKEYLKEGEELLEKV
jgi:thimet oligopeptidase